ncbi:MAG: DUF1127 domain-containing protein [Pseudomonadota bacterium]
MAYASNTTAPLSFGLVARLRAVAADAADAWARYSMYRQTFNELMELSDRELQDLGLSRGVLKAVATETVYGK